MVELNQIDPRLIKIVALAKEGVGGEQANAIDAVKRLCKKYNLNYDDVMAAQDFRAYTIPYDHHIDVDVVAQVCYKYATTKEHPGVRFNKKAKEVYIFTTPAKYLETIQAVAVYLRAYRKERKRIIAAIPLGFIYSQELYADHDSVDMTERSEPTEAEIEQARLADMLGSRMDTVEVTKAIESEAKNG